MDPVSDLRDTRVLIPRLRRALDGPNATASGSASSSLSDEQLNAIGADAIGSVIFYSGSLFGAQLAVSERDPQYMSPIAWMTEPALTEPQVTIIVAQAALDYFYYQFSSTGAGKTQELIADEATRWEWQTSPQALVERLRGLRADRDRALEQLTTESEEADTSWVSFIHSRDYDMDRWVGEQEAWGSFADARAASLPWDGGGLAS